MMKRIHGISSEKVKYIFLIENALHAYITVTTKEMSRMYM